MEINPYFYWLISKLSNEIFVVIGVICSTWSQHNQPIRNISYKKDDSSTLFETKAPLDKQVCCQCIKAQEKTQSNITDASSIFDSKTATNLLLVYVDFANFLLDFCHLSFKRSMTSRCDDRLSFLFFNRILLFLLIERNQ
jgi:hypothetical protein